MEKLQIHRTINNQERTITLTEEEMQQVYKILDDAYLLEDFKIALADNDRNCGLPENLLDISPIFAQWLLAHFIKIFDANISHNDLIDLTIEHLKDSLIEHKLLSPFPPSDRLTEAIKSLYAKLQIPIVTLNPLSQPPASDLFLFPTELELNRAWIYGNDPNAEPIGEKNFVISSDYFMSIFSELFPHEKDINTFLDVYIPESDGEKIYRRALNDGKIIEEGFSKIISKEGAQ